MIAGSRRPGLGRTARLPRPGRGEHKGRRGRLASPHVAALGRPTPASAPPSARTPAGRTPGLRRLDAWLAGRPLEDATLASYLAVLHDQGSAAPSSASTAVAAACFRAHLPGEPSPAGERTARVLAGYRRTAADRVRGQPRPFVAAESTRTRRRRGRSPPAAAPRRPAAALRRCAVLRLHEKGRKRRDHTGPPTRRRRSLDGPPTPRRHPPNAETRRFHALD